MSLDGNTADENSDIDWGAADAEVHAFINELERGLGTYLYGVFSRSGPSVLASPMIGTWPFRAAPISLSFLVKELQDPHLGWRKV